MRFSSWIQTQDPELWQLPEETVARIKSHFNFREIPDPWAFDITFWRTLDLYRARFLELARMQDIRIDPMVNKYVEALNVDVMQRKDVDDKTVQKDGLSSTSGNQRRTDTYDERWGDYEYKMHDDQSNGITEGTDNRFSKDTSATMRESARFDKSEDKFDGEGSNTRTGTINTTRTGGYTDTTKGTTTGETKGENTDKTTDKGSTNGTSSSITDGVTKDATKAAPMNASNIGMTTGDGVNTVSGGHLGDLNFEFASSYAQRDTGAVANNKNESKTENTKENTGKTSGTSKTVNDGTVTRNENGTVLETDNMKDENKEKSTDNFKNQTNVYDKDATNRGSETGGVASQINANQNSGKHLGVEIDLHKGQNVIGSNNSTSGNSHETTMAFDEYTRTDNRVNKNIYTGRDRLTPQEGLSTAEDYYKNYEPAVRWLCRKLETCFISVFDLPVF